MARRRPVATPFLCVTLRSPRLRVERPLFLPTLSVRAVLAALLIIAAIAFTYRTSLDGDFVSDDRSAILNNPLLRSLDADNIRAIFSSFDDANYIPLKVLSLAVDQRLWGPGAVWLPPRQPAPAYPLRATRLAHPVCAADSPRARRCSPRSCGRCTRFRSNRWRG